MEVSEILLYPVKDETTKGIVEYGVGYVRESDTMALPACKEVQG